MPQVAIVMGSESDRPTMQLAADILDSLGVSAEVVVMSAHRTPDRVREYAQTAKERGTRLFIAGAGMAAHLPGVIAAWTTGRGHVRRSDSCTKLHHVHAGAREVVLADHVLAAAYIEQVGVVANIALQEVIACAAIQNVVASICI